MKFKIEKGTEIFDKLKKLESKMKDVRQKANELVERLGGKQYAGDRYALVGGISAIEFDEKPEGWKSVGKSWQGLYYPKSKNPILKEVESLPTIQYKELNEIVEFEGPQTVSNKNGLCWVNTVGIAFHDDFVLLETSENSKYNPPEGVIEILESEYLKLKELL